jgi:hypothetical protein
VHSGYGIDALFTHTTNDGYHERINGLEDRWMVDKILFYATLCTLLCTTHSLSQQRKTYLILKLYLTVRKLNTALLTPRRQPSHPCFLPVWLNLTRRASRLTCTCTSSLPRVIISGNQKPISDFSVSVQVDDIMLLLVITPSHVFAMTRLCRGCRPVVPSLSREISQQP